MPQKIRKIGDLENLPTPKILLAMYSGRRMANRGLKGRRLGPGRYRFRRSDRLPMVGTVAVFVQLTEPWVSERTSVAVLTCMKHGLSCPPRDEDEMCEPCERRYALVEASRWMSIIVRRNAQNLDVEILRYPKVKTVAESLRKSPARKDAGFTVQLVARD